MKTQTHNRKTRTRRVVAIALAVLSLLLAWAVPADAAMPPPAPDYAGVQVAGWANYAEAGPWHDIDRLDYHYAIGWYYVDGTNVATVSGSSAQTWTIENAVCSGHWYQHQGYATNNRSWAWLNFC